MDDIVVREAAVEDADAMGRVHVLAWQAAYRGVMPDDFLDDLSAEERASTWRQAIANDPHPAGIRRLVALLGDEVVGVALVAAERTDPEGELGELVLINLEPRAWGRGVGAQLLARCCDALTELGYGAAVLWVARDNTRARRFYEREGWSLDGAEQSDTVGGATVSEVRYRRELPLAP